MRLTEFWERMHEALGGVYADSWARDHVLAGLGGRTVAQSLAAGLDAREVWLAVHAELQLPPAQR